MYDPGFKQAAEQYIQNLILENGLNIPRKKRQLELELIPFFGNMPLSQIKRADVERFKNHMVGKGRSPETINRY